MDNIFSYWNNSKLCKFRRFATSHSFFNYFSLIFQICTVQWLNCTNLKYELNRSHNGGGVVYLRKSEAYWSTRQYLIYAMDIKMNILCEHEVIPTFICHLRSKCIHQLKYRNDQIINRQMKNDDAVFWRLECCLVLQDLNDVKVV